ncbi:hypothetical protein DFH07DRAFT_965263 [Mycena maculata]|uniref:Uncharacterized protein n=1 Tax=Mycena maculata TaxID=230809 RepID=A0AAD7IDP9_9AGAR|nr:hypothetical protein DFH07DRAFT_965263 [Mycena maculata]
MQLALQANIQLLVVVAAAWNLNVTRLYVEPFPAAALCLILTSLSFFILVALGLIVSRPAIELPPAFKIITSLKFECGWTALLLVLQFAATIGATAHVPPARSDPSIFTSHNFLVLVAWLATVLGLIYVACLIGAVMAHKPMYPEIWSAPASSVDWFVHRTLNADSVENDSWTRYLGDIEASAAQKQRLDTVPAFGTEKAPWAQSIRRGVDDPFAVKPESDTTSESRSTTPSSKTNAALPPLPLRVAPKAKSAGSRFIERFRDSQMTTRSGTTPFAEGVEDYDRPIPLPRWSQWIRADVNGSVD